MAEVFISYARKDKGFVHDLHAALQRVNRDTWIDWRSIPESAKWRAEIFKAIEEADNFLFVISPDSVKSWMCGEEVSHAVAKNKRLITILYHSVERKELPSALAEIQWIDYPDLGFEQTFERLIKAFDSNLEWEHKHTQLLTRATEWKSKNHEQGFLLHGMELKEAVRWLEQAATIKDRRPTELQERYVRASQQWEAGEIDRLGDLVRKLTKKTEELRREAERQSRIALARERVAFSTLSLQEDIEKSILLAMHAVDATRSVDGTVVPESEDALHRAILRYRTGLVSASKDNVISVWAEETSELSIFQGHRDAVTGVAVSRDGRLAVSSSMDRTLRIWDVTNGRELRTLQGHSGAVWGVALSGNGKFAVSASSDNTLKIWDLESGSEQRSLQTQFPSAWSEDARSAALASGSGWQQMRAPVGRSRPLRILRDHCHWAGAVAVTADGLRAVSVSDQGTLRVWDLAGGRPLRTLTGHTDEVNGVVVTPDGRLAVSASRDQTLKVWELASGNELRTLKGHKGQVNAVALTSDGQRAVSASQDGTLKVWELASGRTVRTFRAYTGELNGVAVSSDGTRLASASEYRTVTIFDLKTGRELTNLAAHDSAVYSVAWSPDGKRLLSCGADGIVQVYAMDIDLLMSLARSRVTRNLTPEECHKYLHHRDVLPIP